MDTSLNGKRALITGAGDGIGREIAVAMAREGATVAVHGRSLVRIESTLAAIKAEGGTAIPALADLVDEDAIATMCEDALSSLGGLDVLVNNAGINIADRTLEKLTPGDWDRVMDINATGAYNTIHAVLPHMRTQQDGVVIAVSSMAGCAPSVLGGVAYSAAKHAMSVLTKMVDLEEAKHGIRACVVSPGEINTPILDQRPVKVTDERKARMLQPEDIAHAVMFVATLPSRVVIEEMIIKPRGQGSVT